MYLELSTSQREKFIRKTATIFCKEQEIGVYFDFPLSVKEDITDLADPFVISIIFIMMQLGGGRIEVRGADISPSLKDNMLRLSRLWHKWFPDLYKEVYLQGNEVEVTRAANNYAISTFSGGLDSTFLNYLCCKKLDQQINYDLKRAVLIHGADIPITDSSGFNAVQSKVKMMSDDLALELVIVGTNIRDYLINWGHAHGTVIAGILNFFSKSFSYGVTCDYSTLSCTIPNGFNPFTNKYLTTDNFNFVLEGTEYTRTERANIIKDWKVALENLHVCWENSDNSKNCGICEKCVRTKLNFKVVGVDHLDCMPFDLSLSQILKDSLVTTPHTSDYYKEALFFGVEHQTIPLEWVEQLRKQINRWERLTNSASSFTVELYKVLLQIYRKISLKKKTRKYRAK